MGESALGGELTQLLAFLHRVFVPGGDWPQPFATSGPVRPPGASSAMHVAAMQMPGQSSSARRLRAVGNFLTHHLASSYAFAGGAGNSVQPLALCVSFTTTYRRSGKSQSAICRQSTRVLIGVPGSPEKQHLGSPGICAAFLRDSRPACRGQPGCKKSCSARCAGASHSCGLPRLVQEPDAQ